MYWTPEELGQLRGSAVLEKIGRQEAEDQFLSTMWPVVQKHPEIFKSTEAWGSRERFLEAAHRMGSIIMSYSFDLEPVEQTDKSGNSEDDDEDEEEEIMVKAMVPLADILNADADKNNVGLRLADREVGS